MNKYVAVGLCVVAFGLGYAMCDNVWDRKYLAFKASAEKDYSSLLEKKIEADRANQAKINAIESRRIEDVEALKKEYEKTIADVRANFKPSGVLDCPTGKDSVPRTDNNTSELVCYRKSELLARIEASMAIAKRADELALKYNALVNLINERSK